MNEGCDGEPNKERGLMCFVCVGVGVGVVVG